MFEQKRCEVMTGGEAIHAVNQNFVKVGVSLSQGFHEFDRIGWLWVGGQLPHLDLAQRIERSVDGNLDRFILLMITYIIKIKKFNEKLNT